MAGPSFSNPLSCILTRQIDDQVDYCKRLVNSRLELSENLYRKDLLSHYGCVNAIEFSKQGDLIVSGGDDRRVLLWKVAQALQGVGKPVAMRAQHSSNIFCLGYDNSNRKIFSAGNDDQVIVHDLKTGDPLYYFLHEKPVYGLSVHPEDDNLFSSACDDGRVLIYDVRNPRGTEMLCLAQYKTPFHAVMYNPVEPRQLATANAEEGVSLWDVRKPLEPLLRYGVEGPTQSCMNVRFNSAGTRLLALKRRLPPVLYALNSSKPLCHFDQPGYYNSCTMKSCCFAGEDESYILSGSDDFSLYMWKIPNEDVQWVESAHMILRGHRSIVNHVRYNPRHCILASSGVEKIIKIWSPFSLGHKCLGGLTRTAGKLERQRKVYTHDEYIRLVLRSNTNQFMTHDYSHKSTREDPRMMAFFDSLVQREIEGWSSEDVATNNQNPSDSDDVPQAAPEFSETDSNASAASDSQLLRTVRTKPITGRKHNGGVAPERPFQPPNRITQLIGSCRKKLMRLAAMEGGAVCNHSTKFTRYGDTDTDDRTFVSSDDDEEDEQMRIRRNKLKWKSGAVAKIKLRMMETRNRVRRTIRASKVVIDSDSDMECNSQSQVQTDTPLDIPVIDTTQPSTSSGLRSGSRRVVRAMLPKKSTHSSSSSDDDIPIKRRCLRADGSSNSSFGKPERCKQTVASTLSAATRQINDRSTDDDDDDNINNTRENVNSTPIKQRVPPTPDSGVASSVSSTVEKCDTSANTSRNGADDSDCERNLKKSIECFRKKVDAARKGYRKRSAP